MQKVQKAEAEIVIAHQREINTFMGAPGSATARALVATIFKGLDENNMRKAALEAMIRGFTLKDFCDKNLYALKFGAGYTLVTSIDYARKKGARGGIVGKKAPEYTMEPDGKTIESCTVTVCKKVGSYVGDFTATVYFSEYNKGRDNWVTKPRTMIAKVAEMHALRMACPEELAQSYIEEEFDSEIAQKERIHTAHSLVGESGLNMGNLRTHEKSQKGEGSYPTETSDGEGEQHGGGEDIPVISA